MVGLLGNGDVWCGGIVVFCGGESNPDNRCFCWGVIASEGDLGFNRLFEFFAK